MVSAVAVVFVIGSIIVDKRDVPYVPAKTLVFCSEGSPGGFNPSLHSAGTDFDASAQPIYNRLAEFEPGTTKVVPGLAEAWTASADGLSYTFKLRKGVKWHSNKHFTPTRDFNADDNLYSFNRLWKTDQPYLRWRGEFDHVMLLPYHFGHGTDTLLCSHVQTANEHGCTFRQFPTLAVLCLETIPPSALFMAIMSDDVAVHSAL